MKTKAACGLDCSTCEMYAATVSDDDRKRDEVARKWSIIYGRQFTRADVNCLGCRSDTLFGLCIRCPLRDCADGKGNELCADCADFECDRLKQMHRFNDGEHSTQVRRLTNIRQATLADMLAWRAVAADVADIFGNPDMANDPEFIDYAERKIRQGEALAATAHTGECTGFIGFSRTYNRITWFGVLAEHRNRGIGGALLASALVELDSSREVTVETYRQNYVPGLPARHLYIKHGFIEVDGTLRDSFGNERCKLALNCKN